MVTKYILLLLIFLGSVFNSPAQVDEFCKDIDQLNIWEAQKANGKLHQRANQNTQNYNLIYHRLEWEINPAVRFIKGTVTTYFNPLEDQFQQIHFDFKDNMQVIKVQYHGQSLTYQLAEDDLRIELPNPISQGQIDSILVAYEGIPTSDGFGSFEVGHHNGSPVLWTLSEPYGAMTWWPCKQDLNDKIDSIDIIIRTPPGNRAATNGLLVSEIQENGFSQYHWRHRYPIPAYLIGIAITNYSYFSDFLSLPTGDSIEILNYVYPENRSNAEIQLEKTIEIMALYNELFGIYPFAEEKYGHAQFGWGGGMEHQTMSFMGSFSYGLVAHELAHQWFGDKVTCGSWQDIWLNEGFATYLSGLVYERLGTEQDWQNWKKGRVASVVSQPGGSVWVNDTTKVSRIFDGRLSYNKGAYLLHMLRWVLGDEAFFEGIRSYLEDSALAYQYARTDQLKTHLEKAGSQDLSNFFADWYYGQGFPSYHLAWDQQNGWLTINLTQKTSHPIVDFFEMPVPIYMSGDGQDTLLRLNHTFNKQSFDIDLPFTVESVEFDPDLWLISAGNQVERILTSTNEHQISLSLKISTNPVTNQLFIEISDRNALIDRIEVSSVDGKIVYLNQPHKNGIKLDTTKWIAGLYTVTIWSGQYSTTQKVIKQ